MTQNMARPTNLAEVIKDEMTMKLYYFHQNKGKMAKPMTNQQLVSNGAYKFKRKEIHQFGLILLNTDVCSF